MAVMGSQHSWGTALCVAIDGPRSLPAVVLYRTAVAVQVLTPCGQGWVLSAVIID